MGSWLLVFFIAASCSDSRRSTEKLYDFDKLLDEQVEQVSQHMRTLEKSSELDGQRSDSVFRPSRKEWGDELAAFRELEIINKPAHRSMFEIDDPVRDSRSNLSIRRFRSSSGPVPLVSFFYQQEFQRLRKIEASIRESNVLYSTFRSLTLEFEEVENQPVLSRYSLVGYQKIPLSDTVRFSVSGQIEW